MTRLTVRPATPADADLIVTLVEELAIFEEAPPGTVKLTASAVRLHAFGPRPRFEALIGELDGAVAGLLLFFETFSTWTATPALHVEDFFLREAARGKGLGGALIRALSKLAIERGCARIGLNVLHWNPARGFYERHGFGHKEGWLIYRLDAAEIARLAESAG